MAKLIYVTNVSLDGYIEDAQGNFEVRPVGGAVGCLAMILFSIVLSLLLTLFVNLSLH